MDRIEDREQVRALEELANPSDRDHRLTAADVCRLHQLWLGQIYPRAGKYRHENLKKDDFPFPPAAYIPRLMAVFEAGALKRLTSCRPAPVETLAAALAEVHVEHILIQPFREGNGRVARLLAVLMGLQAGLPALFFDKLSGRKRQQYFAAVRAGLDRDYRPMAKLFSAVIQTTLQIQDQA